MNVKNVFFVIWIIYIVLIGGVANGISDQSMKVSNQDGQDRFTLCYIEVSGYIHNDWPAVVKWPNTLEMIWIYDQPTTIIFGLYSYILFEEDADIKVFDVKGGSLLWQHTGTIDPLVTMVGFSGEYIYTEEEELLGHISIRGNTVFFGVRLKDYP